MQRLAALCLTWLAAVPAAAGGPAGQGAAPGPFHVILVTADAMRRDALGSAARTPKLEALAAEGLRFTRAYCNITTTTPSLATILSGLYPRDHGAYENTARLDGELWTLPEMLSSHGWLTAAIVNMPWLNPEVSNLTQGTDELFRCTEIRAAAETTELALRFLESRRGEGRPFFLWIHYIDTHTPYRAPARLVRRHDPPARDSQPGSLQAVWPLFPAHHRDNPHFQAWLAGVDDVEYVRASYWAAASAIDEGVGKIVARLKALGLWERTLFVFTADHGESLGEHRIWFAHAGLYEATARVPLVIRSPTGPEGLRVDMPVEHADLLSTVLGRLGLPLPARVRGCDIWPRLGSARGRPVFLEHAGAQMEAVVSGRHKYIRHLRSITVHPGYPVQRGREELYDLEADPAEARDLTASRPDVLARMRAWMKRVERPIGERRASRAPIDGQLQENLRSLGYTE
ncbi:MAG: sulfatase-like hydrolase/transferase [Deltaproteobacteria bacterium]|nr:sulfatase-like hydrolase/transferase [Deltaproteobacteria bacterium]